MKLYANVFEVTMVSNKGKESRIKKIVYSPVLKDDQYYSQNDRVNKCVEFLEKNNFRDIKYIKSFPIDIVLVD